MAITLVGSAVKTPESNAVAGAWNGTLPATVADDVLVIGVFNHVTPNSTNWWQFAGGGAGWSLRGTARVIGIYPMEVYTKKALGTEGTTLALQTGSSNPPLAMAAIAYRGVNYATIEAYSQDNASRAGYVGTPSFIADAAGLMCCIFNFENYGSPSGDIVSFSNGGVSRLALPAGVLPPIIADKVITGPGSTAPPVDAVYAAGKFGYGGGVVLGMYPVNTAPSAPTLTTVTGGASYDRTVGNVASHTFNDADVGDSQRGFVRRHRLTSSGTWITVTEDPNSSLGYTIAANSLAAGNYERQVASIDSVGNTGPFSPSSFFTMVDPPAAPAITTPAADGFVVTGDTQLVVWTVTGTQTHRQVLVLDGVTTVFDSTEEASGVLSMTVPFPTNGVSRTIKVRYKTAAGVWSPYTSRTVTVTKIPPATPTITAVATDPNTLGFNHAAVITPTNPAPSGGQPTVISQAIWIRPVGDTSTGTLLAESNTLGPYTWRTPPSGSWEVRYEARAASTTSFSAWSTVTMAIRGVVLIDPDDSAAEMVLIYNDSGAEDELDQESGLITYQGREYPVAEFGDGSSRVISVKKVSFETTATIDVLRALLDRRKVLHYRDAKGRAVYGLVKQGPVSDTFWGGTTNLTITVVDS